MSVASWDYPAIPFMLQDPQGTLNLNQTVTLPTAGTGIFMLRPDACKAEIPLRVNDTNVPQADGTQTHRRYYEGYLMRLAIWLLEAPDAPACDELLQEMLDLLMRHIRALTNPPDYSATITDGRVYWTPAGESQRFLRRCHLNVPADISLEDGGVTQVAFQVRSMYPYAWDAAEITTALSATLTNTGTADFWPVIQVFGPTTGFTITNADVLDDDGNPLSIVYDSTQVGASAIGGADYLEIDTFRNSMYLNGDGANMKPGLVMADSDFFPIAVGANAISISGATANVLWQNAWA